MAKRASEDSLLNAYDCLCRERIRLGKRYDSVVNGEDGLAKHHDQERLTDDFRYLNADWLDYVAATKRKYGTTEIVRALEHIGLTPSGEAHAPDLSA